MAQQEIGDLKLKSFADNGEIQDLKQRSLRDRERMTAEILDLKLKSVTDSEKIQELRQKYEAIEKKMEVFEKMKWREIEIEKMRY